MRVSWFKKIRFQVTLVFKLYSKEYTLHQHPVLVCRYQVGCTVEHVATLRTTKTSSVMTRNEGLHAASISLTAHTSFLQISGVLQFKNILPDSLFNPSHHVLFAI